MLASCPLEGCLRPDLAPGSQDGLAFQAAPVRVAQVSSEAGLWGSQGADAWLELHAEL